MQASKGNGRAMNSRIFRSSMPAVHLILPFEAFNGLHAFSNASGSLRPEILLSYSARIGAEHPDRKLAVKCSRLFLFKGFEALAPT